MNLEEEFKKLYQENHNWQEFLEDKTKEEFLQILDYLSDLYYNDISFISDKDYDLIKEIYEAKFGPYDFVGSKPRKNKVPLPYFIGSLKELKGEEIIRWKEKFPGPYLIEDKIDGLSLILINEGNKKKLITRGDGKYGSDVSYLIDYIQTIPKNIKSDIVIRGEGVIKKKDFETIKNSFKNPRSLVSGIVNRVKEIDEELLELVNFYPFRILSSKNSPSKDISLLKKLGFTVPFHLRLEDFTIEQLREILDQREKEAEYEIDGIVIYQDRYNEDIFDEKPKSIFSFKKTGNKAITEVKDIIWNETRTKKLVPILIVEPIDFGDAIVNRVFAYNARFLLDHKIGIGSKVTIERGGGIIAKVTSVVTTKEPSLPNNNWDENNINLMVEENSLKIKSRNLLHSLRVFGLKNIGEKKAEKIIKAGIDFIDLLKLSAEEINERSNIGKKTAIKLKEQLILKDDIVKLMEASNFFPSFSSKRLEVIFKTYPNFLQMKEEELLENIKKIKGFKENLALNFISGLEEFKVWYSKIKPYLEKDVSTNKRKIEKTEEKKKKFSKKEIETTSDEEEEKKTLPRKEIETTSDIEEEEEKKTLPRKEIETTSDIEEEEKKTLPRKEIETSSDDDMSQENIEELSEEEPEEKELEFYKGKTFVFSGFRDSKLEDKIEKLGGIVRTSVSSKTDYLVIDSNSKKKDTKKLEKAKMLNIRILDRKDI